jgi:hypothetical protein
MARASDSARSRKKREGQKAKLPADLLAAKNKFEKQKNSLTRSQEGWWTNLMMRRFLNRIERG